MEHIEPHLNSTVLKDRILWYDGDFTVRSDDIESFLLSDNISGICTDKITPEIRQYNSLVADEFKISIKKTLKEFNLDWNIPTEYYDIDLNQYFYDKLKQQPYVDEKLDKKRKERIQIELNLFKEYKFYDIIYVLIYIINTFYQHNIVWGVGRGSSVSSYLLFLIGVHDVDSILYELDITDFIHE